MKWDITSGDLKETMLRLRDHARRQAARNALTLFLMAIGFIITWCVIILANLWAVSYGK